MEQSGCEDVGLNGAHEDAQNVTHPPHNRDKGWADHLDVSAGLSGPLPVLPYRRYR